MASPPPPKISSSQNPKGAGNISSLNLIFEQYTDASFQCLRAQSFECVAQDRWLENPDSQQVFLQTKRAIKLGALFERRAAKAFK